MLLQFPGACPQCAGRRGQEKSGAHGISPHYASAGEKSNGKIEDRRLSTFSRAKLGPEVADPFNMQGQSEASSWNRKLTEKSVDRKIVLRDLHDVSVKQFFCHSFLRCALIARFWSSLPCAESSDVRA
jgi:hypothetical protein